MLTELEIKNAKPREKPYKMGDGKGLYVEVMPTGAKYWRLKYRFAGKEKRLSMGVYPEVTLKTARNATLQARVHLANGVDPSELRKVRKASQIAAATNSFRAVGEEWFSKQKPV